MTHFRYLGVNQDREEVGGLIEAADQADAEKKIRDLGLVPIYMEEIDVEKLLKKPKFPVGVLITVAVLAVILGLLLALLRRSGG